MTDAGSVREPFTVLVVDDEKNIRLTLAEAISAMGMAVDTAAGGREALDKVATGSFNLVLLDLRLPDIDGMQVLRLLRSEHPDVDVVIITAHGTVLTAVEAMKLGALDYLSKPFTPQTVRAVVRAVAEPEPSASSARDDYGLCIEVASRAIRRGEPDVARSYIDRAIQIGPDRPQGYNLLGVVLEVDRRLLEAQEAYRRALALDPGYAPARANLHESVDAPHRESFYLSEVRRERIVRAGSDQAREPR